MCVNAAHACPRTSDTVVSAERERRAEHVSDPPRPRGYREATRLRTASGEAHHSPLMSSDVVCAGVRLFIRSLSRVARSPLSTLRALSRVEVGISYYLVAHFTLSLTQLQVSSLAQCT